MALTSASTYHLPFRSDHAPTPERAVAVRRPSSVSSRSTTTRRHRSHRSHVGGGTYLPQNEFPNFALTGDVEITIAAEGHERRYVLHRLILAQNSGFFEASTSEQWSKAQAARALASPPGTSAATSSAALSVIGEENDTTAQPTTSVDAPGPKVAWRYELEWDPEARSDDLPMLVQKSSQSTSLFGGGESSLSAPFYRSTKQPLPPSSNGVFRSFSAMQSVIQVSSNAPAGTTKDPSSSTDEPDTIRDYDNMFRIFYNYAPKLDAVDITEAYIQCKMLLNVADMYDALEVVGPRIDHHLLQFQSRLWKQIAKYPPSYLKLGYLARSRSIFSEALVHVVGQWPLGRPQLRGMPQAVQDLIEDKAADLEDLQTRIEARLLKLSLTTSRGERVNAHSHHLDWSAVAFFRSWIADNTQPLAPPAAKPVVAVGAAGAGAAPLSNPTPAAAARAPARTFRLIGQGGSAYLTHDECKRFAKLLPETYSRDLVRRFERRIDDLKSQARDIVRPLLRQGLQLELAAGAPGLVGVVCLTCTRIDEGEWPW